MGKYKRIILLALFFSFIGVGFSNGLLFKKNKLVEDVIEYDEIVRKVKKSQRKPASIHSAKRAKTRPAIVTDTFQPDLPKNLADVVDENINEADSSASLANPSEVQDSSSEKVTYLSGANQGNQSAPYVPQGTLPTRAVAGANTVNPSQFGAAVSADSGPTYGFTNTNISGPTTNATSIYRVKSITFKDGAFIIKGENLNTVRKISLSASGSTSELEKISSTSSQVMAMGFNALKLIAGKTYSLIIADAYGSSSYPISVELADGSVTPRKFAPLGASEDGYILKWDASSQRWIAAPDEVGAGPDGGITSITKGAGIVGQGASITTVGSIAVDVGSNAGQIPQFDADKKLVLQSDNRISFTENAEEFVFGMFSEVFKLRNQTNDTDIFSVVGNDFLVRGQQVCLSDGTNCPAAGAAVESVSVSAPLTMSGTTTVSLGLAIDNTTIGLNGSSQLSIPNAAITANKLNQMGATPGQVLKWNGTTWAPAVDTDTGITTEADPLVRNFARTDASVPASCNQDETWVHDVILDAFVCRDIQITTSHISDLALHWDVATGGINYAGGRVGIGNTTPTEALDVTGVIAASSAMKVGSNTAGTGSIRLSNTGSIHWRNNSNTADVFGLRKDTTDNFFVGNGNLQLAAGGGTPTMYIGNNNSNVGIGTNTPSQKLEISGGGIGITGIYPEIRFNETDTTGQGKVWRQVLDGKHLRFDLDVDGDGNMSPYTTVLQLNSNGNVGIGTLNPTAKLEVVGVVKATGFEGPMTSTSVSTGTGSAAAPAYSFSNSSSTGLFSSTAGTIGISSGGTHTFSFTSGGISSSTAGGASIATAAGVAANPTFSFAGDEDTGWYSPLADTLAASTGGVERVRISSTGNFGIGTNAPTGKLHISGPLNMANDGFVITDTSAPGGFFKFTDGTAVATDFVPILHGKGIAANPLDSGRYGVMLIGEPGLDKTHSGAVNINGRLNGAALTEAPVLVVNNFTTELMRVSHDGKLGIGLNAPEAPIHLRAPTGGTALVMDHYVDATTSAGLVFRKARGTSAAPTAVMNNDYLGNFGARGFGATAFSSNMKGVFAIKATENWTDTAQGTALVFETTPNLSITRQESMRITGDGRVGVGTTTPGTKLEVRSTTQDASASALRLSSSDGTFAVNQELQMEFAQNTNVISKMGMNYFGPDWGFNFYGYNSVLNATPIMSMRGNGNVGIGTTNPTTKLEVDGVIKATGFQGPMTSTTVSSGTGSSAAPSYSFSNSASTGFYSPAAGVVSISSGGTNTFNFTAGGFSSPTAGGASIGSVAGVAAAPTFSFAGDEDTGWYSPLADTLAASTAGVERMRIDASGRVGVGGVPQSKLSVNDLYLNTTDAISGLGLSIQGSLNDYGGITLWDRDGNPATTNDGDTTVYWGDDVADNLRFAYKGSGLAMSEKMRITSAGDVGIGTTAPNAKLDVSGSMHIGTTSTTGLFFTPANDTLSISSLATLQKSGASLFIGSTGYTGQMFYTSNLERMRIDAAGSVGIGVTAPSQKLEVNGSISSTLTADNSTSRNIYFGMASDTSNAMNGYDAGDAWMVLNGGANSGRNRFVFAGNQTRTLDVNLHDGDLTLNSGRIGVGIASPSEKIEVNGNVKAQAYLYTSDVRLKKNVKTYDNALVQILALRGVKFDWIENDKPEVGFIAQEVEAIEPNLVVTSDIDGIKSVKYANMAAILVEAFKEQHKKVEENKKLFMVMHEGLELRVRKLEREIASLKEDNIKIKEENQRLKEDLELIKKHLKIK